LSFSGSLQYTLNKIHNTRVKIGVQYEDEIFVYNVYILILVLTPV
jgi:hypothetical protein